MKNWTVRRAEIPDAGAMETVIDRAYAAYVGRIDDLPAMSDDCAGEIAKHLVWVAEAGDTIVGTLVLIPGDGLMHLANVAVHPDNKGTGLGRQLFQLAETVARDRGCTELRLTTHADMVENVRLYLGNGWSQIGREGKKIRMKKLLSA